MFSNSILLAMIKNTSSDYRNVVNMVVNGMAKGESNFLKINKCFILESDFDRNQKEIVNISDSAIVELVNPIFQSICHIIELQAADRNIFPCEVLSEHPIFKNISQDRYETSYLLNSDLDSNSIEYNVFCENLGWYAFDLICKDFNKAENNN